MSLQDDAIEARNLFNEIDEKYQELKQLLRHNREHVRYDALKAYGMGYFEQGFYRSGGDYVGGAGVDSIEGAIEALEGNAEDAEDEDQYDGDEVVPENDGEKEDPDFDRSGP